jgi:O-antigen/teichoic acid export membrane protein
LATADPERTTRRLLSGVGSRGSANLLIRAMALAFRFALAFYVVSILGLEAAGIFGLSTGLTAIVPAVLGWGLNYHVARAVVGATPAAAAPLVRNRLLITILSLCAFTLLAACYMVLEFPPTMWVTFVLIIILTWIETIGLDLQLPLIGLDMAFEATFIQFIRTALWIPPIVVLGVASPALRSLNAIFLSWIVFGILSLGVLAVMLRKWEIRHSLTERIQLGWAMERIRGSWYIYLSDLGIVGFSFVDRYIVSLMLGLVATGIYSFYWSITNALQTLIATAVVQVALPKVVTLFRASDIAGWRREIRRQFVKTLALSATLGAGILAMTWTIIHVSPPGRFPDNMPLLFVMTAASVARACSDLLNIGLTSIGRDRSYAATNFLGMIVTILLCILLAGPFGLMGIGATALASALLLSALRYCILRHATRRTPGFAPDRRDG